MVDRGLPALRKSTDIRARVSLQPRLKETGKFSAIPGARESSIKCKSRSPIYFLTVNFNRDSLSDLAKSFDNAQIPLHLITIYKRVTKAC